MIEETFLERIIADYYEILIRYCMARMHRGYSEAEDVVQEVFLALSLKENINLNDNIKSWLYKTANYKIIKYLSKNPWFEDITEIVDLPEQEITEPEDNIFELLSDSELDLLKNYYYGADKEKLASQNGLSVNALYSKVKRIKKRLKESQNQGENKHKP